MMIRVEVFQAELWHVHDLAKNLRAADVAEVRAFGVDPLSALLHSFRGSIYAKTAFVGNDIAAMWGMGGSPLSRIGQPWLLTAPAVERVKRTFLRVALREIAAMTALCPDLRGHVDADYAKAHRFLRAVGFGLGEPETFGRGGALFREFRMSAP